MWSSFLKLQLAQSRIITRTHVLNNDLQYTTYITTKRTSDTSSTLAITFIIQEHRLSTNHYNDSYDTQTPLKCKCRVSRFWTEAIESKMDFTVEWCLV